MVMSMRMDPTLTPLLPDGETDPNSAQKMGASKSKHNHELDAIWDLSPDGIDDLIKLIRPNVDVDAMAPGAKEIWFRSILVWLHGEIERYEE